MTTEEKREKAIQCLKEELESVFIDDYFPIESPFELIPMLPNGKQTTFTLGRKEIPASKLGMKYDHYQEYPYETPNELINDIIKSIRENADIKTDKERYSKSTQIEF